MAAEDPPRLFGALLAVLGLVLAGAGAQLTGIEGGGAYFVVVGAGMLISGVLVSSGRKLAVPVYALTLAVVWIWSLKEVGGDTGELMPRVALPTLLGLYLFSGRIRSRLA